MNRQRCPICNGEVWLTHCSHGSCTQARRGGYVGDFYWPSPDDDPGPHDCAHGYHLAHGCEVCAADQDDRCDGCGAPPDKPCECVEDDGPNDDLFPPDAPRDLL